MDQVQGVCGVRDEPLVKYNARALQLAKGFEQIVFEHLPRTQNEEADHLSRLSTTYYGETTSTHALSQTPFSLVYGSEEVLQVEAGLPTFRQLGFNEEENH
ncbi:hypothetical protein LIER_12069 [Lithospermum erythrorhizon]|uniref:RNase H type-1 domain-containing protein n=1 Tax=Lithospermum erythrorhizon TaxID=34254 RepID=A0AAV3PQX8_LITER